MLTLQEKQRIKEILKDGLRINPNINFPYFLDAIDQTKRDVQTIKSQLDVIQYNQRIIEAKLDRILEKINRY